MCILYSRIPALLLHQRRCIPSQISRVPSSWNSQSIARFGGSSGDVKHQWSRHVRDQGIEEWLRHWPTRGRSAKHRVFTQGVNLEDPEYIDSRLEILAEKYGVDLVMCFGSYVPLTSKDRGSYVNSTNVQEAANSLMSHVRVGHVDYSNGILLFVAAEDSQVGTSRGVGLSKIVSRTWLNHEWLQDVRIPQDITSSEGIDHIINRFEEHIHSLLEMAAATKIHSPEGMSVLVPADEEPSREYYFEVVCIFSVFFILAIAMAIHDGRREAIRREYLCRALNDAEEVFWSRYDESIREEEKEPDYGKPLHEPQLERAYQHFHERLRLLERFYPLQFRRLVMLLDRSLSPQIVFNSGGTTTAIEPRSISPGSISCLRFDSVSFPLIRWYMKERNIYEKRWKQWIERHDAGEIFERSFLRVGFEEPNGIIGVGDMFGGLPFRDD
eukprot:gb/GECG01002055.1/.p1 GENE.gb/GECG01002055.1/~~gb/GECG01002055.1/.p1  ORF type:complete len:440 (+),score=47.09 gb/GECG01002055.1/:1-1320(+)